MSYRWIITKDLIADPNYPEGTSDNARCMEGPRGADTSLVSNKTFFALYDDDGERYYEGFLYGDFDGFEPLDDFGGPNAGCTAVWINGAWL
tara:strand:- start:131 stop:403 length:273 start_codon:yes stop_codon:yes gene_type:complete